MGLDQCSVQAVDGPKVESVSASLLDVEEASELAEMFRLLGDSTRVRILFALLEAGELCVCDCLLYTSPSPRDRTRSRMPSSA